MPKPCLVERCKYNAWGKGYCLYHQHLRPDKKLKESIQRTPIKKVSEKQKGKIIDKKKLLEEDKKFYLKIWEERNHVCECCGISLGNEPLMLFFDHLLEKAVYPELRHEKENIMLLCWQDHGRKTAGFPPPKVAARIQAAKEKFLSSKQ